MTIKKDAKCALGDGSPAVRVVSPLRSYVGFIRGTLCVSIHRVSIHQEKSGQIFLDTFSDMCYTFGSSDQMRYTRVRKDPVVSLFNEKLS